MAWLAACGVGAARDRDRPYTAGLAAVERVDVRPRSRSAARVQVIVRGTLPDACTRLDALRVERRPGRILATLPTRREAGETCDPAPRPFTRDLQIATDDLPSGIYSLEVNGVAEVFEVQRDPLLERDLYPGAD